MKRRQEGFTLLGLLFASFFLVVVSVLSIKVIPVYLEHWASLRAIKTVAATATDDMTLNQVKQAFDRQALVNSINSISSADINVTKQSGQIVISFSYDKRIPLLSNISLLIEFNGSSRD